MAYDSDVFGYCRTKFTVGLGYCSLWSHYCQVNVAYETVVMDYFSTRVTVALSQSYHFQAAKHRTDVEPEILGSAKMDDVATSASMTSLVWKFAILIFIPTFLAILLYFVPFDFSKSTNRFSKIRGAI